MLAGRRGRAFDRGLAVVANDRPARRFEHGADERLAASRRHGEWVTIALGAGSADSVMAWVVYPASRQKAGVVVVVHEIFGLSTWVRGVADQVAADGFIAIAPDFLTRVRGGPTSVELAGDAV